MEYNVIEANQIRLFDEITKDIHIQQHRQYEDKERGNEKHT